jgi:peptidoglycan/LPS O-acetylase OafA/YrhL
MVPSFVGLYDMKTSFPFNPATWSIFFEMVASFLFFFFFGRANRMALIAVAILAWLVLIATVTVFGTIDLGYSSDNFVAGFPRVIFSFTVGVLIERAYAQNPWRCPALFFYMLLAVWLLLVQARAFLVEPYIFDLVMVTAFLPIMVAAGAGVVLNGKARLLAIFLGQTSYAVYLTQGSMIIAAAGLSQVLLGQKIYDFAPGVGFPFTALVVVISYLTYRYYELPARIMLRRLGESRRLRSVDTDNVPPRS